MTKRVGIRELREDLSRYVRLVQRGETVEVTDRGRSVARLVPAEGAGPLADLVAQGKVIPARSRGPLPGPLDLPSRVSTDEAIDMERADR